MWTNILVIKFGKTFAQNILVLINNCYLICVAYYLKRTVTGCVLHIIETLNRKYDENFIIFSTIFKFWCNDVRLTFTLNHIDNSY